MSKTNNNKKMNKILKSIFTLFLLIVCSFALASVVNAIPTWNGSLTGGMPSFSTDGNPTGYFPQQASGGIILCNDQSSGVRSGSKDYEIYYPTVEDYNSSYAYNSISDPNLLQHLKDYADKAINEMYDNMEMSFMGTTTSLIRDTSPREYTQSLSVRWYANSTLGELEYADESKPLLMYIQAEINYEDAQNKSYETAKESLTDKFYELSGEEKPQDLQEGYDLESRDYPFELEKDGLWWGPQVAVMGNGDNSTYTSYGSGDIDTRVSHAYNDVMNAYIYSGEYHVSRQNPTPYTLVDIQVANWLHNDNNHNSGGGLGLPHGYITDADGNISSNPTLTQGSGTRGEELYQEARQYYAFLKELDEAGGYIASVNADETQVFASRDDGNRGNDEYVIGPVSITYPYYHNISYLTDIILETSNSDGDSATLSYANGDFSIVLASNGSEQLTGGTVFPGETGVDNENFYIILNASKAAYPDTINIQAVLEYTEYATAKYTVLKTPGSDGSATTGEGSTTNADGSSNLVDVYRYLGGVNRGDFTYEATCHYQIKKVEEDTSQWIWTNESDESNENYPPGSQIISSTSPGDGWSQGGHPTTTTTEDHTETISVDGFVMQAYIRMDTEDKYGKMVQDVAQELVSLTYEYHEQQK